jgi:rhodanese-related sulfurtransferase
VYRFDKKAIRWELMQANPEAVMIDVRTKVEYSFVGHPVNAVHVTWKEAPDWQINPDFVEQVINSC